MTNIKGWFKRVFDKGDYPVSWLKRKWRTYIAEQVFRIVDKNDDNNTWYHGVLQELAHDCPFTESCSETFLENYEPDHDESRD